MSTSINWTKVIGYTAAAAAIAGVAYGTYYVVNKTLGSQASRPVKHVAETASAAMASSGSKVAEETVKAASTATKGIVKGAESALETVVETVAEFAKK